MRKLMLMVLLATSAAMPAVAQDRGSGRHERAAQEDSNGEREARRAERRSEPAQRPARAERERPQVADQQRAVEQQQATQPAAQQVQGERRTWDRRRSDGTPGVTRETRRQRGSAADAQRVQVVGGPQQQERQYRGTDRRSDRSIIGQVLEQDRQRQGQVAVRRDYDRDGRYQSRHSGTNRQWSNHWRNDRNYDWRHYRDRNRSVYRLGNYHDPYRYGYRRFSIGFSLFPNYYQSNYWLNDPWMYRLPPAYGPYRWVRYYNDALLVNVYTGQVVDVEYNFFW